MARARDATDQVLEEWGLLRRANGGPRDVFDLVGPPRAVPAAAFVGAVAIVEAVYVCAPAPVRRIFDAHWVVLRPADKLRRAEFLGMSPRCYWEQVRLARARVAGALAVASSVRTSSPAVGDIPAPIASQLEAVARDA